MNLEGKRIGFAITASFCNFRKSIDELKKIVNLGAKVVPIMSENSYTLDTKYGNASDFINEIEELTKNKILHTIQEVELLGPKDMLDIMVVAPATGNTIAKLANDITDSPVTMAVKLHLCKERPVVIAVSAYNGLSSAGENIGKLLNTKHYYFVPFRQDNPITKPRSPVFMKIGFYSFYMSKLKYFSDCLLWGLTNYVKWYIILFVGLNSNVYTIMSKLIMVHCIYVCIQMST